LIAAATRPTSRPTFLDIPPRVPPRLSRRARKVARRARRLDDGREFQIVKVFHEPAPLAATLDALGFTARIRQTPRYFIYGDVRDTG